jgi:photosystem II stability/assembly factor-like uncharacterized protein
VRQLGWVGTGVLLLFLTLVVDTHTASAHSPHDDVTDIALSPAYAKDGTVFAIVRDKLMRSTDGGNTWGEIVRGVGGVAQVLARVAFAPSDKDVVYLTTRGDGVLKSEDGGTSWHSAAGGLTNLNLQEIAVSPVSPDLAVAAGSLGGLFRTTDGGASWSAVGGPERVTSLTFLPDGSRVLAGDARGRVSTLRDSGATRDRVLTLEQRDAVTAIATGGAPDSGDIVFAATASGRMFRSEDGGKSFDQREHDLPEDEVRSLELSPDHARDTTLWASTWHSGVFRSADDGETWTPMTDGLTTDPSADKVGLPHFRTVAAGVDGSGHNSLFVGGYDGIFRYDERRSRWDSVETLSEYIAGLAVSPDFGNDKTVAVTTYVKGAFVSQDGGGTWQSDNDGLAVGELSSGNMYAPIRRLHNVAFSSDYANDGTIFSAYGLAILKSTDRGASWKQITVGPPAPGGELRQFVLAVSPSYASDQTVFAATRQGEVFRSEEAGEADTWVQVGHFGVDERVRSLAVSPDYSRDRILYAGTVAAVYTSANGGATWDATGPRMATEPQRLGTDVGAQVAISPAYGHDGTVFAGTDSGLFVTRDAGQSWTEDTAGPLTASSEIEAVAVSPDYQNDGTVLVSTRERGLLRSTDGGRSFRAISTALFDANHLVVDFSNPTSAPIQFSPAFATDQTIFAYAQTDVLRSTDGGDSWENLPLPSGDDVIESLASGPHRVALADGGENRWFETPIGHLSVRRVLAAAAAGIVTFAAMWAIGVGGRRTGQALALRLGGGLVVLAGVLVALAA